MHMLLCIILNSLSALKLLDYSAIVKDTISHWLSLRSFSYRMFSFQFRSRQLTFKFQQTWLQLGVVIKVLLNMMPDNSSSSICSDLCRHVSMEIAYLHLDQSLNLMVKQANFLYMFHSYERLKCYEMLWLIGHYGKTV